MPSTKEYISQPMRQIICHMKWSKLYILYLKGKVFMPIYEGVNVLECSPNELETLTLETRVELELQLLAS